MGEGEFIAYLERKKGGGGGPLEVSWVSFPKRDFIALKKGILLSGKRGNISFF